MLKIGLMQFPWNNLPSFTDKRLFFAYLLSTARNAEESFESRIQAAFF